MTPHGSQHKADCPFCGKEGKLYVNVKTSQWDCKSCSESGNLYTFLEKLYAISKSEAKTNKTSLATVAKFRRLPNVKFERYGFVPSVYDSNRILLPIFNLEGKFSAVKYVDLKSKKPKLYTTANCTGHLFRGELLKSTGIETPVYIVEGEWDTVALEYIRGQVEKPGLVVGAPGAGQFKKDWIESFRDRIVYLLYDNDTSGKKGMDDVADKLAGIAKTVYRIRWPESIDDTNLPEKYDVNDFVADNLKTPKKAWSTLHNLCVELPKSARKAAPANGSSSPEKPAVPLKPIKFAEIVKDYKTKLHLDTNMTDALSLVYAVCLSAKLPVELGDCPLWLFLVGPPSSGKTLMLRTLELVEHLNYQTTLTAQTLVTGWKNDDGEDNSLLATLGGKCLIAEDYGATRGLPVGVQEQLHGYLRSAYNGKFDRKYGNEETRNYNDTFFSFIAGVTHVIHGDSKASVGERFLKFEFLRQNTPTFRKEHIKMALRVMNKLSAIEKELRDKAVRFFACTELTMENVPKVPEWFYDRVACLAEITATLRTHVDRRQGELVSRPEVEIGTRLAKQFTKAGQMLAAVWGRKAINEEDYRIVEQLAMDTAYGWASDVVRVLAFNGKPMTLKEIAKTARISESTTQRKLEDLCEIEAVDETKDKTGKRGSPPLVYGINEHLKQLWKEAKINPKSIKVYRTSMEPIRKFGKRKPHQRPNRQSKEFYRRRQR